jgi:CheY-like chemotaxis protein
MHFDAWAPVSGTPHFVHNHAALGAPSASVMPAIAARSGLKLEPAKPTVLVVEDEPLIRILLCDLLEGAGLDVEDAPDADQALERLSALGAERNPCRVLVTDVNLGRGLDGVALAAEARRSVPGLEVLYVTGTPERVLKGRSTPRPRERVLGKPFHTVELVETVRGLVASSTARS